MHFYAHTKEGAEENEWQLLRQHSLNTAEKASRFARVFSNGELAYVAGILHDIGKYTKKFQDKLRGAIVRVDHSTAGAVEAEKIYGQALGRLIAYCIAGHHAGLPDYGTRNTDGSMYCRMNKKLDDYSAYANELDIPKNIKMHSILPIIDDKPYFSISFFIRMIYSCLVDADFIDTENYMTGGQVVRNIGEDITTLNAKLDEYLKNFAGKTGKINEKRQLSQEECIKAAQNVPGIYTLNVPTGGGKTLSSLAFAIKHALINNMRRIIYIIPYTSIIEQNAAVFKKVLGIQNVLEHHSTYSFEDTPDDENDINQRMKLAAENWDVPVVVTTNVQFFESLFSNKSSKCRKLHNIASSVIIFDEAQMFPAEFLKPCLYAIAELVKNYNCTAVICTATQPEFEELFPKGTEVKNIISNTKELYEFFKRVDVSSIGEIDDESLSEELLKQNQVLCIVNTRKHAKKLYEKIKHEEGSYHLSTLMCAAHRREILDEIRERLSNNKPCRVVSTQLIEAGVDIDFPCVYRSSAGLDSIVQSAGRCNREGRLERGNVYVFISSEDYGKSRGWLKTTQIAGEIAMRKYEDPMSPEAIEFYFKYLHNIGKQTSFDNKEILKCFEENGMQLKFDFSKAAEKFKLIDDNTYSIVIPYNEEAVRLINEARYVQHVSGILRKLQQYTVPVYENEYNELIGVGALESVNGLFMVLRDVENRYCKKVGLIIPNGGEALFG